MPRRPHSNRGRNDFLPLLLLFGQIQQIGGMANLPPVTLICVALNVGIFYLTSDQPLEWVCLSAASVLELGRFENIVISAFFHGDAWHLYYNALSLLWKGRQLERNIGSNRFAFFTVLAIVCSSIIYLGLILILASFGGFDSKFYECAVGFSAVLFAYKVVLTHNSDGYANYWGFRIPVKYLTWFELIVISIVTPNASFIGHLAGILVGFMYVWGLFNPIFAVTDALPLEQLFNTALGRDGDNHIYTDPNQHNNGGFGGGMGGGMGGFGGGMGGFGRRRNHGGMGGYRAY